jgi:K+-sensing histidine kinase KdpD
MLHPAAPELSDLVTMMVHDLKNPLAALMTNLHFLQAAISERDHDTLDALGDSRTLCDVLERFLCNLDLLAREKDLIVRRQLVDVDAIVHEAVTRAQRHASAAGVELRLVGNRDREPSAFVDRALFSRALENTVANALEHAPAGSTVAIEVALKEAEVMITVTDARETLPALRVVDASLAPDGPVDGKRLQWLYGRGLALLCADLAARATGARLEIAGVPRACQLLLVAPVG